MFIQPDHTYRDIQEESNQLKIDYMKKLKNGR